MSIKFPIPRVGTPVRFASASVFPLFSEANGQVDYRLANEAIADQALTVTEVSEAGSVPNLLVENKSDRRVLFLEGDELIGAKQNRVLNTSVLIAARSKSPIPVSCVERGRWRSISAQFGYSGATSPSEVRFALKGSVTRALRAKQGHHSDQGEVWDRVAMLQAEHGVESDSEALADAYESHRTRLAEYQEGVKYIPGATGLAVAIGGRLLSIDLFDKAATCEKVWGRLLSGTLFQIMRAPKANTEVSIIDVEKALREMAEMKWENAPAVGEGTEFRAESATQSHASVLLWENQLVHGSWVAMAV